jgi:membrane-associated phospholipid phosphatase
MAKRNFFSDLRSPGTLGKRPMIGFMMFLIGSMIFIILAYNLVEQGPLLRWDLPLAESFHALALKSPAYVTDIMIAGFYIAWQGLYVVGAVVGLYFLYKRFWRELVMAAVAMGVGGLLFIFLSNAFKRPRPFLLFDKQIWAGSPNIPGFPSGHTLNIVICCAFLAYILVPKIKSRLGKALAIAIALLVVLYVGFGRLYLGDHYLTDIIAGYAVGFAWFGLACTSVELAFQGYSSRKEKKEPGHEKRTESHG